MRVLYHKRGDSDPAYIAIEGEDRTVELSFDEAVAVYDYIYEWRKVEVSLIPKGRPSQKDPRVLHKKEQTNASEVTEQSDKKRLLIRKPPE